MFVTFPANSRPIVAVRRHTSLFALPRQGISSQGEISRWQSNTWVKDWSKPDTHSTIISSLPCVRIRGLPVTETQLSLELSQCHLFTGEYDKAQQAATAALSLEPSCARALYLKAEAMFQSQVWLIFCIWYLHSSTHRTMSMPWPYTTGELDWCLGVKEGNFFLV